LPVTLPEGHWEKFVSLGRCEDSRVSGLTYQLRPTGGQNHALVLLQEW